MRGEFTEGVKTIRTSDVLAKPVAPLTVPVREIADAGEGIVLGLRQEWVSLAGHGGVDCGAGLGTDFMLLRWGERTALIRASEVLRAWVKTFAPSDAARFPDDVKELPA